MIRRLAVRGIQGCGPWSGSGLPAGRRLGVAIPARYISITGNQVRIGMTIELNDKTYEVVKAQHVKPGKGGAFMQVELKDQKTGGKLNHRFRSAESVEKVSLEDPTTYQVLYVEGKKLVLMEPNTYEQVEVDVGMLGDKAQFLTDGMQVRVLNYKGQPFKITIPDTIKAVVQRTEAIIKNATVTAVHKPALLDNGVTVKVPPFVETGDTIIVNTERKEYVSRA